MKTNKDYYNILGVPRNATLDDIKLVYKRLRMTSHPDRNFNSKESEEKFKEIQEAYDVLSDPKKKSAYDNYGQTRDEYNSNNNEEYYTETHFNNNFSDVINDIFGEIFNKNNNSKRTRPQKGEDITKKVELTLEQIIKNYKKTINYYSFQKCSNCNGNGTRDGKKPNICKKCSGRGFFQNKRGFFSKEEICKFCNGSGLNIINYCNICNGSGKVNKKTTISVNIPIGISHNSKLYLKGYGNIGSFGGPNGDLYLIIILKKHDIFKRIGNDLYCDVPVKFSQLVLGCNIYVPVLEGKKKLLNIPAGTQSHTIFRIPNSGIKDYNNKKGFILYKVIIEIPTKFNQKIKKIIENLDNIFLITFNNEIYPNHLIWENKIRKYQ